MAFSTFSDEAVQLDYEIMRLCYEQFIADQEFGNHLFLYRQLGIPVPEAIINERISKKALAKLRK